MFKADGGKPLVIALNDLPNADLASLSRSGMLEDANWFLPHGGANIDLTGVRLRLDSGLYTYEESDDGAIKIREYYAIKGTERGESLTRQIHPFSRRLGTK